MFGRNKRYYLDYAASTPVHPQVKRAMEPYWSERFANPHSIHQSGRVARRVVDTCEETVRRMCHMGRNDYVVWTSGGTESNHWVIDSVSKEWKKNNPHQAYTIAISRLEHPSVINYLESQDDPLLKIVYLEVDREGHILLDDASQIIREGDNLILLSCIFQSSEIGSTQAIKTLTRIVKKHSPQTKVHTDASQGMMYLPCSLSDWGVDFITLCGQKIHGPKGSGLVIGRQDLMISREGTPAVPLIVGLTRALEIVQEEREESRIKIHQLRKHFFQALDKQRVSYVLNGRKEAPSGIINLSFPTDPRDSEQLVIACDHSGLELSSKSACMGQQAEDSRALSAMGLEPRNSLRFSLHHSLRARDIESITARLAQLVR